ncbi:MAG: hypothetical protein IH597_12580 [Bacteroidales bacterium]|nr:hypothetical protein [Bacteroidales bacterium]
MKTVKKPRKAETKVAENNLDFEKNQLEVTRQKTEDRNSALIKIIKHYQKNDK